jgi:hypothetical protein
MEGLHTVGGVTLVSKISIIPCLIQLKCMFVMLIYFHVFCCMYELLLIIFKFL